MLRSILVVPMISTNDYRLRSGITSHDMVSDNNICFSSTIHFQYNTTIGETYYDHECTVQTRQGVAHQSI